MKIKLNKPRFIRLGMAGVIIVGIIGGLLNIDRFEVENLAAWIAGFGMLAPLLYMIGRSIGAIILIPGSLLGITAGMAFGPYWGAIYNLIGSTVGAVLAFLVARYLASDWVAEKLKGKGKSSGRMRRIVKGVEQGGWRFVAFVRLVPLFPYNFLNYALGLTKIKFSHFTIASFIFMIPGDIAYVYFGYAGREAMKGNESSIEIGLIALGLLATLIFLPRLVKYFRATPDDSSGNGSANV